MYLNFIAQISRLLTTNKELVRTLNTTLIMLTQYFGVRSPILLIRDSVTSRYFIDLAPELGEDEKNQWNQKLSSNLAKYTNKFQQEMVLTPDEMDYLPLPYPVDWSEAPMTLVSNPLLGQNHKLPLGVLCVYLPTSQNLYEMTKLLKIVANLIALSMEAHGFTTAKIYESSQEMLPMVLEGVIGSSSEMKKLAEVIRKISTSKATVLIRGESGTGKELIARAIHANSLRCNAPFVGVNCAALSENLLESELFGHEKGAFTGALRDKKGRFELADGGTLFLDEIGDTSLKFQTKLLRVLQEGQFERLGGIKTLTVDVRIVCATNLDLETAIQRGTFREDLFYRLNVIALRVPALRERREDIALLVEYFLMKLNREYSKSVKVSQDDMKLLQQMEWQGNVRELENTIHSAFLMEKNGLLNIKPHLSIHKASIPPKTLFFPNDTHERDMHPLEAEEIQAIESALQKAKGIQVKAADYLGISLRQLRYRIKKYNLTVRKLGIPT